jgi:hypothetical protein
MIYYLNKKIIQNCVYLFSQINYTRKSAYLIYFFKEGVSGLHFQTVVKPAMKGSRPELDLAIARHHNLLEKLVMEKAQILLLAISLPVPLVSINFIYENIKSNITEPPVLTNF